MISNPARVRTLLGVLVTLIGSLVAPSTVNGQWSIETVDSPRTLRSASLRLDVAGQPMIAHGGSEVRLARWTGTSWRFWDVDTAACRFDSVSLALDSAGNPAIIQSDGTATGTNANDGG